MDVKSGQFNTNKQVFTEKIGHICNIRVKLIVFYLLPCNILYCVLSLVNILLFTVLHVLYFSSINDNFKK